MLDLNQRPPPCKLGNGFPGGYCPVAKPAYLCGIPWPGNVCFPAVSCCFLLRLQHDCSTFGRLWGERIGGRTIRRPGGSGATRRRCVSPSPAPPTRQASQKEVLAHPGGPHEECQEQALPIDCVEEEAGGED